MVSDEDLQRLRKRVMLLEGQVAFLYKHLGVTFVPEAPPTDDPRIIEQIKKGNIIEAIKIYRELNDAGLTEAKQAVDEIRSRLGI